jgi:HEAT repeat protein
VVIRRSASNEIQQLVADLREDGPESDVRRESAVARLRVIGPRAVGHILSALNGDPPLTAAGRVAMLRALEGQPDSRIVDVVLGALDDADPDVQRAAVRAARGMLDGQRGPLVLDRLAGMALDPERHPRVRAAATAALAGLSAHTTAPVLTRLRDDPDPAVREAAASPPSTGTTDDPQAALEAAADGRLPSDPQFLLYLVGDAAPTAPVSVLHRLVTALRHAETAPRAAGAPGRHENRPSEWRTVRGAVHAALARRDSRVALYDLRETIESTADALPHGYLDAAALVGDAECLEAVAHAYVRAASPTPQAAWRAALRAAAHAIVAREKFSRRHAVMKRLKGRFGEQMEELLR